MPVKKLNNTHKQNLQTYLSIYKDSSLFMLGNIYKSGLTFNNQPYHGDYLGSFSKQSQINGVLAHYWNGSLMIQTESKDIISELTETFCSYCTRPINQILGQDEQVISLIENLGLDDRYFSSNTQEELYRIDLVNLAPQINKIKNYSLVSAAQTDETILLQWLRDYEIQTLNAENNQNLLNHVKKRVEQIKSQQFSYVLKVDDNPVALCGSNSNLPDVIQIGPIWTPPEYRNNGYARLVLNEVLLKAKEHGIKRAVLFSDNPIAIKIYTAIGFKHFDYYRLAILKQPVTFNNIFNQ